jgi:hypothetical protein
VAPRGPNHERLRRLLEFIGDTAVAVVLGYIFFVGGQDLQRQG